MDGRRGRDEQGEEEGSQRAFGVEGRALRGQILTAAHAAVDLKVQGLRLLLGSEKEGKKQDRNHKQLFVEFDALEQKHFQYF